MKKILLLVFISISLCGCSAKKNAETDQVTSVEMGAASDISYNSSYQPIDDSEFDEQVMDVGISDPLEVWNRMWFSFNDFFLLQMIKPVYNGYVAITPASLRSGLSNMLYNIQAPVRIVNSVLQLEFAQAMVEFGRFMVNSIVGFGGLAEVVKPEKALVPINLQGTDFGTTLAKWGVGEGFYIVWPILGPSTIRDSVGLTGDTISSPVFFMTRPVGYVPAYISYLTTGTTRFNDMGSVISGYETLTKSSIEPYSALRDAYIKLRRNAALQGNQVFHKSGAKAVE